MEKVFNFDIDVDIRRIYQTQPCNHIKEARYLPNCFQQRIVKRRLTLPSTYTFSLQISDSSRETLDEKEAL